MKKIIVTICLILVMCSCRQVNSNSESSVNVMTRRDEIGKIMRKHWINEIDRSVFDWLPAARRKENLSELNKMEQDYYYELSDPSMSLTVPGPSWEIRGPLTIEQVEEEFVREKRRMTLGESLPEENIPTKTVSPVNKSWTMLKNQYIEGDEFYYYKSDFLSWRYLRGREGYVLIRKNEVIDRIVTVLN